MRRENQALRKEVRDLARLHDAGWRLRQAESLREGLAEVLSATIDLLDADMGDVRLLDENGGLYVAAQLGFERDFVEFSREFAIAEETGFARTLGSGNPVTVEDVELDPAFAPYRSIARAAGYRAVVLAPLIGRHRSLLGIVSTYFRSPHCPGDTDMQRLELYQRRAADFIERFRSDEALRESNAKLAAEKKATAKFYEAGLKVLQAQSLSEALDILISGSIELLGADMGIVLLLDSEGKLLRVAAQQGFTQDILENFFELSGAGDNSHCRVLRSGRPVVIEDVEADETYAPFRSTARKAGYRAIIAAPLVARNEVPQGVMVLHYRSPHRPSDTDLEHLELYRRRGGDFIERFKAEEALRESNAKLAAESKAMAWFYEAGLRLWHATSLQEGLEATLEGTIDLLGADMGAIHLLDGQSKLLRLVAHRGLNQRYLHHFREVPGDDGIVGKAMRSGSPLVIEDTELDRPSTEVRSVRRAAGYRAFVLAPLTDSHGTRLGMLSIHFHSPHRPKPSELRWLELYQRRAADFILRFRARDALGASEERLRLALEAGHMATWDSDARTGAHIWNDEFYRLFGYQLGEIEPSHAAWARRIHPDDRAAAEAVVANANREHKGYVNECRVLRPDGSVRWIRARGRFIYYEGEPVRTIGLVEDVTESRQQIETQRVLVAELQHRTRNLMAVVQSIAIQTLHTVSSLAEFEDDFNSRLAALSRVQSLLSRADNKPINLGALVVMELEAFALGAGDRITFGGPEAPLRKSAVEMLSLAIHELLTNAIKYGTLALETGRLSVTWRIEGTPTGRCLVLEWIERGIGPSPRAADRGRNGGYGRMLIEEALPYSIGATTSYELGSEGLCCLISLPLSIKGAEEMLSGD